MHPMVNKRSNRMMLLGIHPPLRVPAPLCLIDVDVDVVMHATPTSRVKLLLRDLAAGEDIILTLTGLKG